MDTIPQELKSVMVQFMDDKTKRQMRLASTRWFNIIKYNDFVLYYMRGETIPAAIERLSKYRWPIKLTLLKSKLDKPLELFDYITKLTNLVEICTDSMDVDIEHVTEDQWMRLSALSNLEVNQFFVEYAPIDLLTKYSKLTEWTVTMSEEELTPILKQLINLDSLHFYGSTKTWPYALVPYPEKLTKLHMTAPEGIEHGKEMSSRLTNLQDIGLDLEHGVTIDLKYATALDTAYFYCDTLPNLASNTNLTHLRLGCKQWNSENAEAIAKLYKLRSFEFHYPEDQEEPVQLSFVSNLTQLRRFVLENNSDNDISETIDGIYDNLPSGLTSLTVEGNLDLDRLTHLTNLEELRVTRSTSNYQHLAIFSHMTNLSVCQYHDEVDLSSIAKLTKLEDLAIEYVWGDEGIQYKPYNCDFLSELTNLTSLRIEPKFIQETFWRNISNLSKIQTLWISGADSDDRLLVLTNLKNLKALDIDSAPEESNFTGVHFTMLTSLQAIRFGGDGSKLVHKRANTIKKMPYLLSYSCFIPLTFDDNEE